MSNTSKPWDYARPFQPYQSDSYAPGRPRADGDGYASGCRRPGEYVPASGRMSVFEALVTSKLMQAAPSWVEVRDARRQEKEVYGRLVRSFQTWTDVPVFQWHRWYDWNFHINPRPGFDYIRGLGNTSKPRKVVAGVKRRIVHGDTMECEWDCGSFGPQPGGMFSRDWAWPLTDQYAWLAGRWIYDCGHSHGGKMHSELHPCKAVATARWEGVKFRENRHYVPGIQFMFFASRRGGYMSLPPINRKDHRFIVDLPKIRTLEDQLAAEQITVDIGATPDYPLNTGVVRMPRLLHKFDFAPFSNASGTVGRADPVIEAIPRRDDPTKPPEQVLITIPLTNLPADVDAYGVIVSLGWYDPEDTLAPLVRRCDVRFDHLYKGGAVDHDTFSEEWMYKLGVNGRWGMWMFENVRNESDLILNWNAPTIYLAEDDALHFSSHGAEIDLVGDYMTRPANDRTVFVHFRGENRRAAHWFHDVDSGDVRRQSEIARKLTSMMSASFADENDPLGIIDAGTGSPMNPFRMRDHANGTHSFRLSAFVIEADDIDLIEQLKKVDYILHGSVTVRAQ